MKRINLIYVLIFLTACSGNKVKETSNGVTGHAGNYYVSLCVVRDNIIRVLASDEKRLQKSQSLIVMPEAFVKTQWKSFVNDTAYGIETNRLNVSVNKCSGQVSFFDKEGKLLLKENAKRFIGKNVILNSETKKISQSFALSENEAVYGLGQNQNGVLNQRGSNIELYQRNREVYIPFIASSKNYGILWDNYSCAHFGLEQKPLDIPVSAFSSGGLSVKRYSDKRFGRLFDSSLIASTILDSLLFTSDSIMSASLTGKLNVSEIGRYTFAASLKGMVKIWLDDSLIYEKGHPYIREMEQQNVLLDKKSYQFKIEVSRQYANQSVQLAWYTPAMQSNDMRIESSSGDAIDYYFVAGSNLDEVIKGYRQLTGKVSMLPSWAFGLWQSKERYKSQQEIIDVVKEYRKREIPLDNIVQDWFYWKEAEWGSHHFDAVRYPNPKAMIQQLNSELHTNFMISVWPKFYPGTANFNALNTKGFLYQQNLKDSIRDWMKYTYTFYDVFNPEARKLFWSQVRDSIYVKGVNAWWLDASEPEMMNSQTAELLVKHANPTFLGPGYKYVNAYPLYNSMAVYNGQREEDSSTRVFILTRSAFPGMQKYASTTWSGDVVATWQVFRDQIPAGLNFVLSGMPYWTTDIGGFFAWYEGNNENEEYRELFTRWFQFGTFCPLFRVHGSNIAREMWLFGDESYKIQLQFDKLRYALMPYIYSVAAKVTSDDYTMMRPLVMDFTSDAKVLNIGDQFMFGPSILVNPVTRYKATERKLYLPSCNGWYDFWTGAWNEGGIEITAKAPLSSIPLYVKAGSIIPFGPNIQYTGEKPNDPILLRVYTGGDAEFTLYDDEGTNYNCEKGAYSKILIKWNEATKQLAFAEREGEYKNMPTQRRFDIVFVTKNTPKGYLSYPEVEKSVKYEGKLLVVSK